MAPVDHSNRSWAHSSLPPTLPPVRATRQAPAPAGFEQPPPLPPPPPSAPPVQMPLQQGTRPAQPYVGQPYQSWPNEDPKIRKIGRRLLLGAIACIPIVGALVALPLINGEAEWDPALEPYVAFVEQERGLEFRGPVEVRWANIADELNNPARGADMTEQNAAGDDPWSDAYRLLGLIDSDPNNSVEEAVADTMAENAGAFYEPWSQQIVLPSGQSEASLSLTIVHELTHALQHQHAMLGGAFDSADTSVARGALIEGDAERIAMAWFHAQSEVDQRVYLEAIGYDPDREILDPGNRFLEASFHASYEIGLPLVQTIVAVEGVESLNNRLRSIDVGTTELLIDVFGASETSTVDAFTEMRLPNGAEFADGDLGALTWFQALAPMIGTEEAFDAIIGYDDDAFAVFTQDGARCARFSIYFDTAEDAIEFATPVADLLMPRDSLSLSDTSVELDVCEPIGDPELQRFGTILPLIVLNETVVMHLEQGETPADAVCAARAQASTIRADRSVADFPGWEQYISESPEFLASCR